jgi:HEPN domain-containing protein
MPPKRRPADDPLEWLSRARSNLEIANANVPLSNVYVEDLCFEAQQAVEKAIKAVLLHLRVRFPYTHDLAKLLTLVKNSGQSVPSQIRQAGELSKFAVITRYPGFAEPVSPREYKRAVKIAARVINWAEKIIATKRRQ